MTVAVLLASLALAVPRAQVVPVTPGRDSPDAYPPALRKREGPAPPDLAFRRLEEIGVPGPLPGGPLRFDDGHLSLPLDRGLAVFTLGPEIAVSFPDGAGAERAPQAAEALSPDGKRRYRCLPEGLVLAEHRSRRRWRPIWKLRVAGATPAPPLLAGRRLFFGSLDNQVYAVRADNGHRLWAVDVGDRVSRPLALWRGKVTLPEAKEGAPPSLEVEAILVVPDGGGSLLALDAQDGRGLATLNPPSEDSRLIPPALSLPDGRVFVALQNYAPGDAALLVLDLEPVKGEAPAPESPLTYNVGNPREGAAPGDRGAAKNREREPEGPEP